jgi:DUF3014 family protein
MKSPIWWITLILAIAGIATILYFHYWYNQAPEPLPQAPTPAPAEVKPEPETKAEPKIQYPVTEPEQMKPLPALGDSDAAMKETLTGIVGQKAFAEFFYLDRIIRRIVATVDNLPREKVAQRLMPVKPVAGRFLVTGKEDDFEINPANYARYAPYIRLAETVNVKKLVAAYVYFYPLFQQAYKELGYPAGYFNDRLVVVIDHMLAAPNVQGPVKLVQPRVFYQFADPELESLSAGQKIMIRMGTENAARVKAKLKEIRRELTRQELEP